jgi:hypothetical protein
MGLPCPIEMENDTSRLGYGLYRIQVDLMTYSLIRKKNLIFLLDALWGTDYEQDKPLKFQMAPFNNTYSSSVFASLDNVAIESVAYDFLRSEFTVARANALGHNAFIQMRGCDDYLHQAADSTNWPEGIKYDPDSTGVHIYSLGVHEHWNDPEHMQYSRNLGTGNGIELIKASPYVSVETDKDQLPAKFVLYQNYPNPFNPSTVINFNLARDENVNLSVYDVSGKLVKVLINDEFKPAGSYHVNFDANTLNNKTSLSSGIYYYQLRSGKEVITRKMILIK